MGALSDSHRLTGGRLEVLGYLPATDAQVFAGSPQQR